MRVAVVVALALMAGCTDGSAADDTEPGRDLTVNPLAAPAPWQVGQWWTYRLDTVQDPITWAVTEDAGDGWVVDVAGCTTPSR